MQKAIFSSKFNFNNNFVKQQQFQKYLGVYLNGKLDFREYLRNTFKKVHKTISLLRKLQNNLPRAPPVTIYKSFIRPHLHCGDILYDHTFTKCFCETLESIQYNAGLAITSTIRGTSR